LAEDRWPGRGTQPKSSFWRRDLRIYVHHACGFSIFNRTDKTSSGETAQGTRCVVVDVRRGEHAALVVRGYLTEEERGSSAALKKAIEAVLSDIELDLQSETAERTRARV
jgi:hypothetical protein